VLEDPCRCGAAGRRRVDDKSRSRLGHGAWGSEQRAGQPSDTVCSTAGARREEGGGRREERGERREERGGSGERRGGMAMNVAWHGGARAKGADGTVWDRQRDIGWNAARLVCSGREPPTRCR